MKAQSPLGITPTDPERRGHRRIALTEPLPARAGRVLATVVDLSEAGARLRHETALPRGSTRFSFRWGAEDFATDAKIAESRVVNAGNGVSYESRLVFRELAPASHELLQRVIAATTEQRMSEWLKNLHGEIPLVTQISSPLENAAFTRCFLVNGRWKKELARDGVQPRDGFLVPNTVSEGEIGRMCRGYELLDADGRELLRLFAVAG